MQQSRTMSSFKCFNFALWILAISLTPHVSADGIRATANRLRTFDGADPATYMTSSVASVLPDYDKLLKFVGDDREAALQELATVQTNVDEELEQEKDEFDAFIETIESIMIVDGMSMPPSLRPSMAPSFAPATGPSNKPSTMPSFLRLSTTPSFAPTGGPSNKPSDSPTTGPSIKPSTMPSFLRPSMAPSFAPSTGPSSKPSDSPTAGPSNKPSTMPSFLRPSTASSFAPSTGPSNKPSDSPSAASTPIPTKAPSSTNFASSSPSVAVMLSLSPSFKSSATPSVAFSTAAPSFGSQTPSLLPSADSSARPTTSSPQASSFPTASVSLSPTRFPDQSPASSPKDGPTVVPSSSPSRDLSSSPSGEPSSSPSGDLSSRPSAKPSSSPSGELSSSPSDVPSNMSMPPSLHPSTVPLFAPTIGPSNMPSTMPSFLTSSPTDGPTSGPTTAGPTAGRIAAPSPTAGPSPFDTANPTSSSTSIPTLGPTAGPMSKPTSIPTTSPTAVPTLRALTSPTSGSTSAPSSGLTAGPTVVPTSVPTSTPVENDVTVARFIATTPDLTQLNRAVLRAGFEGALSSNATMFTLFAGTEAAFATIPASFLFLLFENDEFLPHLRNLLTYNILMGELFEDDFTEGEALQTFNGETVEVTLNPFRVNGVSITGADNDVSNGAVQIIDDILTPSWVPRTLLNRVQQDTDLSITLDFLTLSGFSPGINQPAFGNFTLLAPTDTAWIALGSDLLASLADPVNLEALQDVILYHILDGVFTLAELFPSRISTFQGNFVTVSVTPRLRFDQALVVAGGRDILANNGVLQKIDSVLDFNQGIDGDSIFDFIAVTPDLSIFLGALQRSGLGPALANDDGTLTVFAPTNAAFNALPAALREILLVNNEFLVHLQSLLLYHILPQIIASEDFVNDSNIVTTNGESVNVLTDLLRVNLLPFQSTDFNATNGFTNTILGVLLPSWVFNTLASRVANDPDLSILNDFFNLAGIDLTPDGALTLLAPINAAWNALGFVRLQQLRDPANRAELINILAFMSEHPFSQQMSLASASKSLLSRVEALASSPSRPTIPSPLTRWIMHCHQPSCWCPIYWPPTVSSIRLTPYWIPWIAGPLCSRNRVRTLVVLFAKG